MQVWWLVVAGLAAGLAASAAHHSIATIYDSGRKLTVEGTVLRFRFVYPHPFIDIEVTEVDGSMREWHLEMDNRGELAAIGVNEHTLKRGDRVVVTGSASRMESNALYVRVLRRPTDGFQYEQVGASPRITRPSTRP